MSATDLWLPPVPLGLVVLPDFPPQADERNAERTSHAVARLTRERCLTVVLLKWPYINARGLRWCWAGA